MGSSQSVVEDPQSALNLQTRPYKSTVCASLVPYISDYIAVHAKKHAMNTETAEYCVSNGGYTQMCG